MERRGSNVHRDDRDEDEMSSSQEEPGGAAGRASQHAAHLFHRANVADVASGRSEQSTQQIDNFLQQLQTLVQQAQQQSVTTPAAAAPPQPAPAPPLPVFPSNLSGMMHPAPPRPQAPSQAQQQDAIPMLVNALLTAQSATTSTPNAELNHTLLVAMTQIVQYRNLAQFLTQVLTNMIGAVPLHMLLAMAGGFTSLPPLANMPQAQRAPGDAFLSAFTQGLTQRQQPGGAHSNPEGNPGQQVHATFSQFQNFLQQLGSNDRWGEGGSNHMSHIPPQPQMNPPLPLFVPGNAAAAAAASATATGNSDFELSGIEDLGNNNSSNNNKADSDENVARRSLRTAGRPPPPPAEDEKPPIPLPIRKKRKYDHESFPEKLHRLVRESHENRTGDIVRFTDDGTKFQILDCEAFEDKILPQYFRHNRISSFKRVLRMYNFRRIQGTWMEGIFEHPLFVRDHPEWCKQMQRQE